MDRGAKLQDIHIGMEVGTDKLSAIYGVYFLLSNTYINQETSCTCGTVEYIGEKNQEMLDKYTECMQKYGKRPLIYHNTNIGGNESWDHF